MGVMKAALLIKPNTPFIASAGSTEYRMRHTSVVKKLNGQDRNKHGFLPSRLSTQRGQSFHLHRLITRPDNP